MSGLEIAGLAVGVAGHCYSVFKHISNFVSETSNATNTVSDFAESIQTLKITLKSVRQVLENQPQTPPFAVEHHHHILQILKSCKGFLDRLKSHLPELPDNPGYRHCVQAALELSLKADEIQNLLTHIKSYTQVLQLSVTTLGLASQWQAQKSHDQIQHQIRRLTNEIRSLNVTTPALEKDASPVIEEAGEGTTTIEDGESLAQQIEAWRSSADDVAAVVSLGPESRSGLTSPILSRNPSVRIPEPLCLYDSDPEEDIDCPSQAILRYQVDANKSIVSRLIACGVFIKASEYQRKGILLREQLYAVYNEPFSSEEKGEMEEQLAEIHLLAETKAGLREAKTILEALLREERRLPASQQNPTKRARLYHKVGGLLIKLGQRDQGIVCLSRSLKLRETMNPPPFQDLKDTADELISALKSKEEFDIALGYSNWLSEAVEPNLPPATAEPPAVYDTDEHASDTISLITQVPQAYAWCKSRGFNADNPGFGFEVMDSEKQTTPLSMGVQEKDVDIVKAMLNNIADQGRSDRIDTTALILLAASTRDKNTVAVVLEHTGTIEVADRFGMTPLHRCQSRPGGEEVEVAELLLDSAGEASSIINKKDNSGRTPLFMSCEMGNLRMVELLLRRGADPNIGQSHVGQVGILSTPTIAAIESKAGGMDTAWKNVPGRRPVGQNNEERRAAGKKVTEKKAIVKALLDHGADPWAKTVYGGDAYLAARNASTAGKAIRELLDERSAKTSRRSSTASSSTGHFSLFSRQSESRVSSPASVISRFSFVSRRQSHT